MDKTHLVDEIVLRDGVHVVVELDDEDPRAVGAAGGRRDEHECGGDEQASHGPSIPRRPVDDTQARARR